MSRVSRSGRPPALLSCLALASLVANVLIVVTGAAVRLTGSGLGCPTWPQCTADGSYTTTAAMGVHGAIEFGNRLLTFALVAVALAGFVVALLQRPRRRSLVLLSGGVLLYIPGQAIVGGVTVLTDLNPWVVGLHFLLSIALIAVTYAFWRRVDEGDGLNRTVVPSPIRWLAGLITLVSAAVIVLGVVVTGSGPHAGDADAKRNGLDPERISQIHADLVFLLIGLSVALWFALRAVPASPSAVRAAGILVLVELSQGLIGFVQYFTGLPVLLVGAHMLGAGLVWVATLAVLWNTRKRLTVAPGLDGTTPPEVPAPATAGGRDVVSAT